MTSIVPFISNAVFEPADIKLMSDAYSGAIEDIYAFVQPGVRWRTTGEHYVIQKQGRFEVFQDYHLGTGDVIADTDPPKAAPIDEKRFDETEIGVGKFVTLTEALPQHGVTFGALTEMAPNLGLGSGVIDHDVFTSIYNPGKLAP